MSHGMMVASLGAMLLPLNAHASSVGAGFGYALGVGFFAFIMGIAAATRNVTNEWRRTRIFFAHAGICVLVSWVALILIRADDKPFMQQLGDALLVIVISAPIPFVISFTLLQLIGYFTDSDDHRNV